MNKSIILGLILFGGMFLYYQVVKGFGGYTPEKPDRPDNGGNGGGDNMDTGVYEEHELRNLSNLEIMTRTMYGEARSCSNEEVENVGHVIMNRKLNMSYPNSVKEVCLQNKQFSCWNTAITTDNQIEVRQKTPSDYSRYMKIRQIASRVMNRSYNPLPRVYHFLRDYLVDEVENNRVVESSTSWAEGKYVVWKGKHYFLR